jgi:hypothetical protein
MDFTFLESAAEISTHDLFILIKSSNRRSSSAVHWLPRCPAMSLPCLRCFFLHDGITTSRSESRQAIDSLAWLAVLANSLCSSKYIDDRAQAPEPFVDEIKGIAEAGPQMICPISQLCEDRNGTVRGAETWTRARLLSAPPRQRPSAQGVSSPRHRHEQPGQRSAGIAHVAPDRA